MSAAKEIALYEQLASVHDRMLMAAETLAWDDLVVQESTSSQITRQLQALPPVWMDNAQRTRKHELIQHVLEKQERIREEISSWRSDIEPLLQTLARRSESIQA